MNRETLIRHAVEAARQGGSADAVVSREVDEVTTFSSTWSDLMREVADRLWPDGYGRSETFAPSLSPDSRGADYRLRYDSARRRIERRRAS